MQLPKAVEYKNGKMFVLDQRKLPIEISIIELTNEEEVWQAINTLTVRGAPAIGIAGAYGLLISLKKYVNLSPADFKAKVIEISSYINSSRPTAVNLSWSLSKMSRKASLCINNDTDEIFKALEEEANIIYNNEIESCKKIGEYGEILIRNNYGILTHCNAGALAVSEYGTALSPIYEAFRKGRKFKVYADETRPLLQGARLTAWELSNSGVDTTLICDNMVAYVMSKGLINMVIVGCDRVATNGDTANKIGTLNVAILAKYYNIPFYVACPYSTYDINTQTGNDIIIEERKKEEVTTFLGITSAPTDINVVNPSFDITPAELITAFITDKGIIKPPFEENFMDIDNKVLFPEDL